MPLYNCICHEGNLRKTFLQVMVLWEVARLQINSYSLEMWLRGWQNDFTKLTRKYPVWCALPVVEHCLQFTTLECDGCDSPDENDHRIRKNTLNWVMCCQKNIHCTVCMPVFNINLYLTTGQVYLQSSVSCVFLWGKLSLWFVLEVK